MLELRVVACTRSYYLLAYYIHPSMLPYCRKMGVIPGLYTSLNQHAVILSRLVQVINPGQRPTYRPSNSKRYDALRTYNALQTYSTMASVYSYSDGPLDLNLLHRTKGTPGSRQSKGVRYCASIGTKSNGPSE
jgi:hypothetical protein